MNQWFDRLFRPYQRYQSLLLPELEPELALPGLSVLGLNSSRPVQPRFDWSTGRLGRHQLRRLGSWSEAQPEEALRVLSIHHPLARPEGNQRELLRPGRRILAALAAARVDLVCSGHFHQPLLATLDAPGFAPLLSLASTAISHRQKGSPNGFARITGTRDALEIEGWIWEENCYRCERRVGARRGAGGWELLAADAQPQQADDPAVPHAQEVDLGAGGRE